MNRRPMPAEDAAPPRFCPRCQGEGRSDGPLCGDCGETLRDRGYCAICERFWKLPAGAACPKHEVELIDEVPSTEAFDPAGGRAALVTVATFAHPNQANAPRIRLEAEGIPTFLDGEHVGGNSFSSVATGGVRLQVPAPLASAARVLMAQTWSPPAGADEDLDDAWEELAPEPGARRRAVMKVAIWVILCGPPAVTLLTFALRSLGITLR